MRGHYEKCDMVLMVSPYLEKVLLSQMQKVAIYLLYLKDEQLTCYCVSLFVLQMEGERVAILEPQNII